MKIVCLSMPSLDHTPHLQANLPSAIIQSNIGPSAITQSNSGRVNNVLSEPLEGLFQSYERQTGRTIPENEKQIIRTGWKIYLDQKSTGSLVDYIETLHIPSLGVDLILLRDIVNPKVSIAAETRIKDFIASLPTLTPAEKGDLYLQLSPKHRSELVDLLSNEQMRSERAQELLRRGVESLYRTYGIHTGVVTTGGKKADAALLFKSQGSNTIQMISNSGIQAGSSLEKLLETEGDLVFQHYILGPNGEIRGTIKTRYSEKFRELALPPKNSIKNIPRGRSGSVHIGSHGEKELGVSNKGDDGIVVSLRSGKASLGSDIVYKSLSIGSESRVGVFSIFQIYISGSEIRFIDQKKGTIHVFSFGINSESTLYGNNGTKVSLERGLGFILQKDSNAKLSEPQAIEGNGNFALNGKFKLSNSLEFSGSIGKSCIWAPNVFPNTFGKVPLSERGLTNFLCSKEISGQVEYILGRHESVTGMYAISQYALYNEYKSGIAYTKGPFSASYEITKSKSKNPFISENNGRVFTGQFRTKNGKFLIEYDDPSRGNKIIGVKADVQF